MKRRTKLLVALSSITALVVGGLLGLQALAYQMYSGQSALSNVVQLPGGSLSMDAEGNLLTVIKDGPNPGLFNASLYASLVHDKVYAPNGSLDGQGDWPFLQADIKGENANNGYLLVADQLTGSQNEQQWASRLGGNVQYVESYLTQNDQITVSDKADHNPRITFDAFASLVTESGAKFGTTTDTLTGQKDASGNPIVSRTFTIYESAPPTAQSVSVSDGTTLQPGTVTQGDTLKLTLRSNIPLWSGLAAYHYNAVQLTNNATGQSMWAVGSGSSDFQRMQSAQGGHGQQMDNVSFSNTSNLQPGTYTATYWVADGVDRISQSVTTTFTVQPGSGQVATGTSTVSLSANPIQLPTGQSSTLTASAQGSTSSDYIQIVDQSGNSTLGGLNFYNDLRLGETSLTASALDGQAQTTTYVAELIDSNSLQVVATSAPVSVTWASTAPLPPTGTITLSPSNNQSVTGGTQEAVSYTTTGWQYGDYVQIVPHTINASDTWSNNNDQASSDTFIETEYPQNGQSAKVSYTAYLYNSSGQVISVSQSGTLVWTSSAPTIQFTASPTSLQTGQASQLSYSVSNLGAPDYVTITGSGGSHMWNVTKSTIPGDSYSEVENPSNGASTTVTYTANVYDSSGSVI